MSDVMQPRSMEKLWRVSGVAEFLGVSASWVYLHVEQKDLPFKRIGGLVRFCPEEIRGYVHGERKI